MFKIIKTLVYTNILLCQTLFFSIYAILGLTYAGSGESSIYKLYLVLSSSLAYGLVFLELVRRGTVKPIIGLVFFVPIVFLFFVFLAPAHSFVKNQTDLFFVLVLPASLVGYIVSRTNTLYLINKGFVFSATIVFIAVLKIIPTLASLQVYELMDFFGGGQYQAFSYFCAFSFLTFLCHYLSQSNLKVWRHFLSVCILLVLVAGVVLSGGRGGLMVVFVGLIVFIIRKKGFLKFIKYFVSIAFIGFILLYLAKESNFSFSERIGESFDRLFSFISSDGIDMEGTSNRDDFYNVAIAKISESLIFGYGIFGLVGELGDYYPHNIFLEVLLQGGLIYLSLFLILMACFFYKLVWLVKLKKNEDIILIPTIYWAVLLLFSSSYLQEPFFWFSLTYIFSYPFNKINNKEIEIINTDLRIPQPQ